MKRLFKRMEIIAAMLLATAMVGCGDHDDKDGAKVKDSDLYAIVVEEGTPVVSVSEGEAHLRLSQIEAYSNDGYLKIKNSAEIDSKAFPIPKQYCLRFFSKGEYLFEARLNSIVSSYLPSGLTICLWSLASSESQPSLYRFSTDIGEITPQQSAGMKRMFQILSKTGREKEMKI